MDADKAHDSRGFDPWARKIPHATGQLSLCATTTEARVLLSPYSATREVIAMRSRVLHLERSSCSPHLEKSPCSSEDPVQAKRNKYVKNKKEKGSDKSTIIKRFL